MEWDDDSSRVDSVSLAGSRACSRMTGREVWPSYNLHSTVLYAVNRAHEEGFTLAEGNVRKLIEDASFPNQWPTKETHIQHKVLYKNGVSKEYGVHGSNVGVDFDICIADGICITVCPVNVFDRMELPGEQEKMDKGVTNDSGKAPLANWKADPAREQDCIFCRACEIQCPVQAIKITEP